MRILAYCLMPNHWHLLLWPRCDGQLAAFMQRLQVTHVRRWHEHRHSTGRGHVYQGAFKSFPVEEDNHFLVVARYVERNALRARLVGAAQQWRWSSLWRREKGSAQERGLLSEWPVLRRADWVPWVNQPQTKAEVDAIRESVNKGRPFGSETWQRATAEGLGLESTFRKQGRPKKRE
jgi:putative transposase